MKIGDFMLKVIIIDDESMTREGLVKYVDWHKYGFKVFGEAADGLQGLELAKQVQPDLAICDIRMPHMDGIELVKNMKKIAPDCKVVFLSGYTDKEYLKSAIKLDVVDYLEKPVNMDELSLLLTKVRNEHSSEIDRINNKNKLKAKMDQGNQYLLNSIIERLISARKYNKDTLELLMKHMGISFPLNGVYRVVLIKDCLEENFPLITRKLKETMDDNNLTMLIGTRNDEVLVIHAHEIENKSLENYYNNIFSNLSKNHGIEVEIGLGKKVMSFEELHYSYQDAMDAIEWEGYKNKNTLVHLDGFDNSISVVRDAERYIADNFDSNLTIKDIADEVYLTPQYLCKVFKTATGNTINSHITDMRMDKAKELLLDRNLKLYEVAAQVGYRDANYFARVFKRYFDMNPSEYREKYKV